MKKKIFTLGFSLLLMSQYSSASNICSTQNIQADRNKTVAPKAENDICDEMNIDGDLKNLDTVKQWLQHNPNSASCSLAMTLPGMLDIAYSGGASFEGAIAGGIDVCSAFQTVLDKTSNDINSMVTGLYQEIDNELNSILQGFFDQYASTDPTLVNSVINTELEESVYITDPYYAELWKEIERKLSINDPLDPLTSEELDYLYNINYNIDTSENVNLYRPFSNQSFYEFQNTYGINLFTDSGYTNNNQLPDSDPDYAGVPSSTNSGTPNNGANALPIYSISGIPQI